MTEKLDEETYLSSLSRKQLEHLIIEMYAETLDTEMIRYRDGSDGEPRGFYWRCTGGNLLEGCVSDDEYSS